MAPEWFRAEVKDGMARLLALSLPGSPPADTIKLTRESWIESLWPNRKWVEEQDAERLKVAFCRMCSNVERWPAPTHLLRHMPARPQVASLPAKQNKEQKQAMREAIANIKRQMKMP